MKKRRFGAGRWNGTGGKLEEGESVIQSAVRETREEIMVEIEEEDLVDVAHLHFEFENNPEWNQDAVVFFTEKWEGEPRETEEMSPKWFKYSEIPYDSMWKDDIHWLPRVLKGEKLEAFFKFSSTGDELLGHKVNLIL